MAFKVLFMWVLDVSSIGQLYMVMNLLLNPSIKSLDCYHHSAVEIEGRVQNLVRKDQTRKSLASMLTQLCPSSVWRI